jgi:ribosomal protein S18 acetylase RimI-like enzyme
MLSNLTIRPATTADADMAACLIGSTMGGLANHLFAPRTPTSVIAALFPHRGNRFSHKFADVAESDGSDVGLLLSHPGRTLNRLALSTAYRLLRLYGAAPFARFAARALPFSLAREANADEYFISALAVSPAFQGKGVGTCLLAHADDKARTCGLARCTLTVDAGNGPARHLYERLGYRLVGTLNLARGGRAGGFERLYRMVKEL